MELTISIQNRKAAADPLAFLTGGNNSDTVRFVTDAEWDEYPEKTARFVGWCDSRPVWYRDVLFTGDTVNIPEFYGTTSVGIGLYAGDVLTSTAAVVACLPPVTDTSPHHAPPDYDVYTQLLAYLSILAQGGTMPAGKSTAILGGTALYAAGEAQTEPET